MGFHDKTYGDPNSKHEVANKRAPSSAELLDHIFTYHAPEPDQIPKYNAIREAAKVFGNVLDDNCPPSADRTAAMRQLQDCVMTANRAIALKGKAYR